MADRIHGRSRMVRPTQAHPCGCRGALGDRKRLLAGGRYLMSWKAVQTYSCNKNLLQPPTDESSNAQDPAAKRKRLPPAQPEAPAGAAEAAPPPLEVGAVGTLPGSASVAEVVVAPAEAGDGSQVVPGRPKQADGTIDADGQLKAQAKMLADRQGKAQPKAPAKGQPGVGLSDYRKRVASRAQKDSDKIISGVPLPCLRGPGADEKANWVRQRLPGAACRHAGGRQGQAGDQAVLSLVCSPARRAWLSITPLPRAQAARNYPPYFRDYLAGPWMVRPGPLVAHCVRRSHYNASVLTASRVGFADAGSG